MATIFVTAGDNVGTIQSKMNQCQAGDTLQFSGGSFDFQGQSVRGKTGVTVYASVYTQILNGPPAATSGAFDFSGLSGWFVKGQNVRVGKVLDLGASCVNATGASSWQVNHCRFTGVASGGYDGSAVRCNGASLGRVTLSDFINCEGNVIGMYNMDRMTFVGNYFSNCWQPFSCQFPVPKVTTLGRLMRWTNNFFTGARRACIEAGPNSTGHEYMSGTVVENNIFDDFNPTGDIGTMLPISLVALDALNTRISGNYIRAGSRPNAQGYSTCIEMAGPGECYGNTISNWGYVIAYEDGGNFHDNNVWDLRQGFVIGQGGGNPTFGPENQLSSPPADPVWVR